MPDLIGGAAAYARQAQVLLALTPPLLRFVPYGTAHFDRPAVTLLVGSRVIHAAVAEGLVQEIVDVDRYPDPFTTVIDVCAFEQFAVHRKFPDKFQLQVPIEVRELLHGPVECPTRGRAVCLPAY
jgi:hypothetical protein